MSKGGWEHKLWEYRPVNSFGDKYHGFTVAKTEFTAIKNAIADTKCNFLNFTAKEIKTPGFKLVPKDESDAGTGEADNS